MLVHLMKEISLHRDVKSYPTFTMPGIAVDVVKITDPLLTPFIAINEFIMLPVFTGGTGAFKHIFGASSADKILLAREHLKKYSATFTKKNVVKLKS